MIAKEIIAATCIHKMMVNDINKLIQQYRILSKGVPLHLQAVLHEVSMGVPLDAAYRNPADPIEVLIVRHWIDGGGGPSQSVVGQPSTLLEALYTNWHSHEDEYYLINVDGTDVFQYVGQCWILL